MSGCLTYAGRKWRIRGLPPVPPDATACASLSRSMDNTGVACRATRGGGVMVKHDVAVERCWQSAGDVALTRSTRCCSMHIFSSRLHRMVLSAGRQVTRDSDGTLYIAAKMRARPARICARGYAYVPPSPYGADCRLHATMRRIGVVLPARYNAFPALDASPLTPVPARRGIAPACYAPPVTYERRAPVWWR